MTKPPRDKKGRFVKGYNYSITTQFKKGQHWRKKKLFWDKEWLENEYINKKRSSGEISRQFNITEQAVSFWLKKFNIKTRNTSECRKVKYWGCKNEKNPQWKGDNVGYQALHCWIRRNLKRKDYCDWCGKMGEFKKDKNGKKKWSLDWSNISHNYLRNKNDWQYLCKKCHKKYDKQFKKQ